MSVSAEQREQIVNCAIREISHIATLPEVTLKIIDLVEDPNSTAQDLHQVISHDPALCARILKVVNSSFYGLPGQIASINRAIVMLGLNAVKNIAIAASLAKLFRGGELSPDFTAKDLWTHSIETAAICKCLADKLKYGLADEAFLSGLMHNIGIVVEMQFDRNKLIDVIDGLGLDGAGTPLNDMRELEQQAFGADHTDFGTALCEKWKFPKVFRWVTAGHHDPLSLPEDHRALACFAYIADRVVATACDGFRADLPSIDIDPAVMEQIGLTQQMLDEIIESAPELVQDAVNVLS